MSDRRLVFSRHVRNGLRKEQVDGNPAEECVHQSEATAERHHGRTSYWRRYGKEASWGGEGLTYSP